MNFLANTTLNTTYSMGFILFWKDDCNNGLMVNKYLYLFSYLKISLRLIHVPVMSMGVYFKCRYHPKAFEGLNQIKNITNNFF
jgi:hypothetical protein